MTAKNDITGDLIKSKTSSETYRDNWERIFGKKEKPVEDTSKKEDDNEKTVKVAT